MSLNLITPMNLYYASEDIHSHPDAPKEAGRRSSFIPAFSAGSTNIKSGGVTAGIAYVEDSTDALATEDQLLLEAVYPPPLAPRAGAGSGSATTAAHATTFTNRANFLSNAWSTLGKPEPTSMRFARARIHRYRVTNVTTLASSLSEVTPAAKKITHLTGEDSNGNAVEAWVYVEKSQVIAGKLQRIIHQIGSPCLLLPPNGPVDIAKAASSGSKTLSQFITTYGTVGSLYVRGVCWISGISNNTQLQANSSLPPAGSSPNGVNDWRGQTDLDELC